VPVVTNAEFAQFISESRQLSLEPLLRLGFDGQAKGIGNAEGILINQQPHTEGSAPGLPGDRVLLGHCCSRGGFAVAAAGSCSHHDEQSHE